MLRNLLLSACVLGVAAGAHAQESYPNQPIRIIVPFTPGGGTDFLSRTVAAKLGETTKWNVVAENRPGAPPVDSTSSVASGASADSAVVVVMRATSSGR